eukprot:gi/632984442/ref/XP_007909141.1/ PREDICTED: uncharacterized protein LOC103190247 isoform X2 [Callorhinchus milii]
MFHRDPNWLVAFWVTFAPVLGAAAVLMFFCRKRWKQVQVYENLKQQFKILDNELKSAERDRKYLRKALELKERFTESEWAAVGSCAGCSELLFGYAKDRIRSCEGEAINAL